METLSLGDTPRKSSFAPIWRDDARLLVLGSLPGEASLAAARYYAHPQNQFWRLMGAAIGAPLADMDYEARLAALVEAKVALWDVVASATREGSLDTAIRNVTHNPLADLVARLPDLRFIAFNGQRAASIGTRALGACRCTIALAGRQDGLKRQPGARRATVRRPDDSHRRTVLRRATAADLASTGRVPPSPSLVP